MTLVTPPAASPAAATSVNRSVANGMLQRSLTRRQTLFAIICSSAFTDKTRRAELVAPRLHDLAGLLKGSLHVRVCIAPIYSTARQIRVVHGSRHTKWTGGQLWDKPRYIRTRLVSSYGPITIAIRARFEYDSSAIQHPTRSYVLSSNNEHVNSFALL